MTTAATAPLPLFHALSTPGSDCDDVYECAHGYRMTELVVIKGSSPVWQKAFSKNGKVRSFATFFREREARNQRKAKKNLSLGVARKKMHPKSFFWNPFLFCAAGKKIHRCTGVAECERTFEKKSRVIPQKNHGNEHSFGKRKTALVSKAAGSFIFYKPFRVTSFAGFKKTEKKTEPPQKNK